MPTKTPASKAAASRAVVLAATIWLKQGKAAWAEQALEDAVTAYLFESTKPPRIRSKKQKAWDDVLEALAIEEFGESVEITSLNDAEWRKLAVAAARIRQGYPTVTPIEIRRRARNYRMIFPDLVFTAMGLSANWRRSGMDAPVIGRSRKQQLSWQEQFDENLKKAASLR